MGGRVGHVHNIKIPLYISGKFTNFENGLLNYCKLITKHGLVWILYHVMGESSSGTLIIPFNSKPMK